jgi:glycosyltransferase involved in cell wall biosynthesis
MKLVIISHTKHYLRSNGTICGWGATVRELNHVAECCDELIHLAPLHQSPPPDSSLDYESDRITVVPLKPSGGHGLKKLSILSTAFYNLQQIYIHTASADYIQFRAPTGMGVYVLPFLKWWRPRRYWVKYAGNWVDPNMPLGNRWQKLWLKYIDRQVKVTINGRWEKKKRFLAFENPSLTAQEFRQGQAVIDQKQALIPKQLRLIFVGSLSYHKGVHLIIEALKELEDTSPFSELLFVGDGKDRPAFEKMTHEIDFPIRFLGQCAKAKVAQLLSDSHILLLPSKSEGFPKVIGEAMNFGCIPIVSKVSCIPDYVKHQLNGLVLDNLSSDDLKANLIEISTWSPETYRQALKKNAALAHRFTYEHYNFALRTSIFNAKL